MEWRYLTVALALGLLLIMASLFASGQLRFQFFPAVEGKRLYAVLHMPEGTPIEVTAAAASPKKPMWKPKSATSRCSSKTCAQN